MVRAIRVVFALFVVACLVSPFSASASDEPAWQGLISNRPTTGSVGLWTIGERNFTANDNTEFNEEHGSLGIGACAEVQYFTDSSGMNIASQIETKFASECSNGGGGEDDDLSQIYGKIDQYPSELVGDWMINGIVYSANSATQFKQEDGSFTIGGCVEVKFTNTNEVNIANEIESQSSYKCKSDNGGGEERSQNYGVLVSFPSELVGPWVIGTSTYTATANTRYEQERGPFFVGGCVDVAFAPNTTDALEIRTTEAEHCSGGSGGNEPAERKINGIITAIAPTTTGIWEIGGGSYLITTTTELKSEDGPLSVGTCVSVEYITQNSSNIAKSIEHEDAYKCGTAEYTNTAYDKIEALPDGNYGTWIVGGISYEATATTEFGSDTYAISDCVKVRYTFANNVNTAVSIEREDGCDNHQHPPVFSDTQKVLATIDSLPAEPFVGAWQIGGEVYTATTETEFEQEHGGFASGVCVAAKYQTSANGNIIKQVESKPATRCQGSVEGEQHAYGNIELLPTAPYTGEWQIGGVSYQANTTTTFEQGYGLFSVGAFVEVGFRVENGQRIATKIETHVAPGSGRIDASGTLETRPSDDTGTWVINGITYQGDAAIEIALPAANSGALLSANSISVIANAYRGLDGSLRLTSISATQRLFLPLIR